MNPYLFVLRHPTLRLIAVALLLLGAHNASVYPYQSLIAIEKMGLSKPAFSLMLVMASAIAVTSSVLFGVLGDQYGHRRRIALFTALCSTLGIALMLLFPGPWALILCQGVLIPLASSLYGQLFALARLASAEDGKARDMVLGTVRSTMSITFLATLIFWTLAFAAGASVMAVYVSAGIASLGLSLLVLFGWPHDGQTIWTDQRSGMNLRAAFRDIAQSPVLIRLLCIGALSSAGNLYMVLVSLVFDASPVRDAGDVALYVGLAAGWEVPAMLILPRFAHLVPRSTLIALGAAVYCVHLVALPVLADTQWLWGMTVFAGVGGAAIITGPIRYYQDLMVGRPGTAASMLALQKLVSDVLTAATFAIGSALGGFETVALIGGAVALTGAAGLYLVDRRAPLYANA